MYFSQEGLPDYYVRWQINLFYKKNTVGQFGIEKKCSDLQERTRLSKFLWV